MSAPTEDFKSALRDVLTGFYDPAVLRKSPLAIWLGLQEKPDVVRALRNTIISTINSLKPDAHTPVNSRSWRAYQIMRRHYVEQVTQRQVAFELGLSVRQLQREESYARDLLSAHLWDTFGVAERLSTSSASPNDQEQQVNETAELSHLEKSLHSEFVLLEDEVGRALTTLAPLLDKRGIELDYETQDRNIKCLLPPDTLHHALTSLTGIAIRNITHPHLRLSSLADGKFAQITITSLRPPFAEADQPLLSMSQHLVQLCGGQINITETDTAALTIAISLPIVVPITVLVIDDNTDTLSMFGRYLVGSPYQFVGSSSAEDGLKQAARLKPDIIVVDIMMPGQDGWELLNQLREHPATASIPVIVCSILPQSDLALALGASGFVSKPTSRAQLLEALNRQVQYHVP